MREGGDGSYRGYALETKLGRGGGGGGHRGSAPEAELGRGGGGRRCCGSASCAELGRGDNPLLLSMIGREEARRWLRSRGSTFARGVREDVSACICCWREKVIDLVPIRCD